MHAPRDIGIDVKKPARDPAPGDFLNPFNGSLPVRGSVIVGTVVTARMTGTCVVEKQHQRVVEKFERIEKRTRRYPAHVPSNLDVKVGDEVTIAECRPISKTVNFVVVENRGNPVEAKKVEAPKIVRKPTAPKQAPKPAAAKAAPKPTGEKAPAAKPAAAADKPAAKAPKKEA